jgi:putative transposase
MNLVESHIISKNNPNWALCDSICFKSKNLYNSALYTIKNNFDLNGTYLNYHTINSLFIKENNESYRALSAKVAQQTLMLLDRNYKSYFKALKEYNKNPSKFNASPKLPKFKHKEKGRFITTFTQQAISKKELNKNKTLILSGTDIKINTYLKFEEIQQVRIIPLKTNSYKIEIIYTKQEKPLMEDNGKYCGIDLGVNNLFALSFNDKNIKNIIINGKPLKSINQFYNKRKAELQSKLKDGRKTSKKIDKLTEKRNNKVKDYLHKSTRKIVDILKENNISKVVIGKNDQWKQDINIGKKNNQNFVSIPHAMGINILVYKLLLEGINNQVHEESYTSKCSAYDNEKICKHENYVGSRIKRGLFRTKENILVNADINGASNILRKVVPRAFSEGIEGLLVNPMVITMNK